MQRLGKNIGGYLGEQIDIHSVLRDIEAAALEKNWLRDEVPLPRDEKQLPLSFVALRRPVAAPRKHIYISAGIHGDEPAGPLAVLRLLNENRWPADASLWLCPCLNLTGFRANRRENEGGFDLNRDYRHLQTAEVRAHIEWLKSQPDFNIALCLHEDWESHGFYVYELNPDKNPSFAEKIIAEVSEICPVDISPVIEKWPAENGIIRPDVVPSERPQWPEALYLIMNKTRMSYTLEAPSDFPLETRVAALIRAVRCVLDRI
jgi:hypothetical protein